MRSIGNVIGFSMWRMPVYVCQLKDEKIPEDDRISIDDLKIIDWGQVMTSPDGDKRPAIIRGYGSPPTGGARRGLRYRLRRFRMKLLNSFR